LSGVLSGGVKTSGDADDSNAADLPSPAGFVNAPLLRSTILILDFSAGFVSAVRRVESGGGKSVKVVFFIAVLVAAFLGGLASSHTSPCFSGRD